MQSAKKKKNSQEKIPNPKKKDLHNTINWLVATYPNCFNLRFPRPLKVGIINDIFSKEQWPHSKKLLRKGLGFYAASFLYQNALLRDAHRISLEGVIVDEVTEPQKQLAKEKLEEIKEKRRLGKVMQMKL